MTRWTDEQVRTALHRDRIASGLDPVKCADETALEWLAALLATDAKREAS